MLLPFPPSLELLHEKLTPKAAENGWFAANKSNSLAHAFAKKRAVHAGMSGEPVAEDTLEAKLAELRGQERSGVSAAYVHLPYCESKCLYCGFFGGKYTPGKGATYLDALLWEIEAETAHASTHNTPVQALYLGGGTPTALAAEELNLLITTLRKHLPLANDCEITVEGRIHNFGEDKIQACLDAGANRFSLGVQTFDTKIRQMLGRFADKDSVIKHLEKLASYNQAAIVIDLIYGLPGQSVESWAEDIRTFLALPIDGVDLYQLNVFPGSALDLAISSGKVPPTVPLHEQGEYFLTGVSLMQEARYNRLSMSHWGRKTRERNMYNPLAKTRADCLHFGSGSGGVLHGYFMFNEPKPDAYMASCNSGKKPVTMMMAPPAELAAMRVILEHMEMCRLNLDDLTLSLQGTTLGETGHDAAQLFAPLLNSWEEAGLITRDGRWMELTLAGQFWQVNLTQALLGWQRLLSKEI